jgi:hypothetical protein
MVLACLATAVAIMFLVTTATSVLPAHAASPEISLSQKCNNAADVTDNGRDVWVLCQGLSSTLSNVVEIAVSSGEIIADVASPSGIVLPDEIASNTGFLWIKDSIGGGSNLAQFATPSGRHVRLISGSAISVSQVNAIAATPSSLWIANGGHNIVEISASSGESTHVSASLGISQPTAIGSASNAVWVLNETQSSTVRGEFIYTVNQYSAGGILVRTVHLSTYNADTGRSTGVIEMPGSISATPHGLWIDSAGTEAIEISPANGHVVRTIKDLPYLGQKNGPHLIYASGNELWVAANTPALYEYNATTGHLMNTSGREGPWNGLGYYGIAGDSKYIWVMNSSLGQLAEFRRSSGALVRAYT